MALRDAASNMQVAWHMTRACLPGKQYQMSHTREANAIAKWVTEKLDEQCTKDAVTFCFTDIIEGPGSLLVMNKGQKTPVAALLREISEKINVYCIY